MDQSILQLTALIWGFAGGLTAIAEYNVPQLRDTFWGANPFQIKHAAIQRLSIPVFLSFAAIGVLLQIAATIWGASLPVRLYGPWDYALLTSLVMAVTYALIRIGHFVTHRIAVRDWLPAVYATQKNLVERAWFASQHDWLFQEQAAELHLIDPDALPATKAQNHSQIEKAICNIPRLLDQSSRGSLSARIARLRAYLTEHAPPNAGYRGVVAVGATVAAEVVGLNNESRSPQLNSGG